MVMTRTSIFAVALLALSGCIQLEVNQPPTTGTRDAPVPPKAGHVYYLPSVIFDVTAHFELTACEVVESKVGEPGYLFDLRVQQKASVRPSIVADSSRSYQIDQEQM